MIKGKVIKKGYFVIQLENGEEFEISKNDIKKHQLKDNDIVIGTTTTHVEQDKYYDGEYSRSYTETKKFIVNDVVSKVENKTLKNKINILIKNIIKYVKTRLLHCFRSR